MWKSNQTYFFFYSLQIRTVKVCNISLAASLRDIREFFSFSGDIQYVEMQRSICLNYMYIRVIRKVILKNFGYTFGRETDRTQLAYVTFKDSQGADTAMLLSVCPPIMVFELLVLTLA